MSNQPDYIQEAVTTAYVQGAMPRELTREQAEEMLEAAQRPIRRDERAKVEGEVRERLFAEAAKHKDRTRLRVFVAAALDNTPTPEQSWGTTKDGVAFHCRGLGAMSDESRAALDAIVDHAASLSPEELESYANARRSIVDARSAPEAPK